MALKPGRFGPPSAAGRQLSAWSVGRQEVALRVVSRTPSELVLVHRPLVVPLVAAAMVVGVAIETAGSARALSLGEWIAAGLGMLVGSFISYLSALRTRVVFDASSGHVHWQHFGWPGRARGGCSLSDVTGVEVLDDQSGASRLALSTTGGVVPLTRHFTGFERHAENAAAVREWLLNCRSDTPAV